MSTGMILDGIAASEAIDSSGEILDVEGCDISSWENGDGVLNYEHRGDEAQGASGNDVVGKILYAKKIFKRGDCETDRQRAYWDKVKLPYIYFMARLFDGAGHEGAKALAAIIRDHVANNEPIIVRWSIEGSTLEREGNKLKRSVARRCAATLKPCNKTAVSGLIEDPNAPAGFKTKLVSDDPLADLVETKKHEHPMFRRLNAVEVEGSPLVNELEAEEFIKAEKQRLVGGKGDKTDPKKLDPKELRIGTSEEHEEHGGPKQVAEEIATDHLTEDPHYYSKKAKGKLNKTTIAGTASAAPGSLTGGAALQREDVDGKVHGSSIDPEKARMLKNGMLAAIRDYDGPKRDFAKFKEFVKARLPEASDEFIDHFKDLVDDYAVKKSERSKSAAPAWKTTPKLVEKVRKEFRGGEAWPTKVELVPISSLNEPVRSWNDCREEFSCQRCQRRDPDQYISGLVQHISQKGELPPVVLSFDGQEYSVLDGQHRLAAASDLGATHVPALVVEKQLDKSEELSKMARSKAVKEVPVQQSLFGDPAPAPKVKPAKTSTEVAELPAEDLAEHVDEGKVLTIRGTPAPVAPGVDKPHFDPHTGTLHTPRGSFKVYIPADDEKTRDGSGALTTFNNLLGDNKINAFHSYAMEQWSRVNGLLKNGKLPPEIVMHATLFSQLSPNTPVPIQELMYGHLVDTMKRRGIDARSPEFQSIRNEWLASDQKDRLPEHEKDYFHRLGESVRVGTPSKQIGLDGSEQWVGSPTYLQEPIPGEYPKQRKVLDDKGRPIVLRRPGEMQSFMLANNKFKNMAQYHTLHNALIDLVSRHGDNARAAVQELMFHKMAAEKHEQARDRAINAGRPDPGPYLAGPAVPGLAPKTGRYTWGMLGGGNVMVPDTHFSRNLFGLDKGKDGDSISYLKSVLWNPNNSEVLNALDKYYAERHPAVQHMLDHPQFRHLFSNREDAIFPAFWKHWVAIAPHEAQLGLAGENQASNLTVDHRPYWMAIDPYLRALGKSEGEDEDLPFAAKTANMQAEWQKKFGEVPAMHLYFRYLVPALLDEAARRERSGDTFKFEETISAIDLRKAMLTGSDDHPEHELDTKVPQPKPDLKYVSRKQPKAVAANTNPMAQPPSRLGDMEMKRDGSLVVPDSVAVPGGTTLPLHDASDDKAYLGCLHPHEKDKYHVDDDEAEYIHHTVHEPWERAMHYWLHLNTALREGRLPMSVVKLAGLFSAMSPNTSVPRQEYYYGHVMDMLHDGKLSLDHPITPEHVEDFENRARSGKMPHWNKAFYEMNADAIKVKPKKKDEESSVANPENEEEVGDLPQILGFSQLDNVMPYWEDLLHTHGDDVRSISGKMMAAKAEYMARRAAYNRQKKIDPSAKWEEPDFARSLGFGPKLSRYALAMMGGGNIIVPDRHLLRSLYNLHSSDPASEYLTKSLIRSGNERFLQSLDQHFFEKHPAVKYVLNRFPNHFAGREEQAIFPAMWLHWLTVPHFERRQGRDASEIANGGTDHRTFMQSLHPILRRNGIPGPGLFPDAHQEFDTSFDPEKLDKGEWKHPMSPMARALSALGEARMRHGDVASSLLYFSHIVPFILSHEHEIKHEAPVTSSLHKMEALTIDLRKAAADVQQAMRRVVRFGGQQVVPGKARVAHLGREFDLLREDPDHYVAVPSEVGAQNWSRENLVKLPKNKQGTHYQLIAPPHSVQESHVLDSSYHGLPEFNTTPEQQQLIDGVDLRNWTIGKPSHAQPGAGQWVRAGNNKPAFARFAGMGTRSENEWTNPHNDCMYYQTARNVFGLGDHVARVALFRHPKNNEIVSLTEGIQNPEHYRESDSDHRNALLHLGKSGLVDKLALMDEIMGIPDRHDGNWVLSFTPNRKKATIHLFDNEHAGGGQGLGDWSSFKEYLAELTGTRSGKIHPQAARWIVQLDPQDLHREMSRYGTPKDDVDRAVKSLQRIQQDIRRGAR